MQASSHRLDYSKTISYAPADRELLQEVKFTRVLSFAWTQNMEQVKSKMFICTNLECILHGSRANNVPMRILKGGREERKWLPRLENK